AALVLAVLWRPLDPAAVGDRLAQLVDADVAVAEPLGEQPRQLLGATVRLAGKSDDCHRAILCARARSTGVRPESPGRPGTGAFREKRAAVPRAGHRACAP